MKYDLLIHYTPNEISRIIEKSVCPVCKDSLDTNSETSKLDELICSTTSCLDVEDHYHIMWEYKDPKNILLTTQVIEIIEENKKYDITLYQGNTDLTHISIIDNDSNETISNYYDERIFNFKKFNRKQWLKEIKTMMLLG